MSRDAMYVQLHQLRMAAVFRELLDGAQAVIDQCLTNPGTLSKRLKFIWSRRYSPDTVAGIWKTRCKIGRDLIVFYEKSPTEYHCIFVECERDSYRVSITRSATLCGPSNPDCYHNQIVYTRGKFIFDTVYPGRMVSNKANLHEFEIHNDDVNRIADAVAGLALHV